MPHLVDASITATFNQEDNFLSSISSIKYLQLYLLDPPWWCNTVTYSRLIECCISNFDPEWCESLVVFLSNCPKLKVFRVDSIDRSENHVPVLWNQPTSVPECLSYCLEFFRWTKYAGREDEKQLIWYIVQNSKCLKRAKIWLKSTCNLEEKRKMTKELKSLPKVLTSASIPDPPARWKNIV
ncbi:unnamed protein product [Thlaspi arvense]|uniref:FBD domain-containing protein n=1 Tax=Thlaspi arvense TaxID=13288 RepID=A0AAU9SET5_THLAR|nr:unnamed protein product [Thlaspi arvense]